tara:strand:+ start:696 stop:2012 length:1317 start_codon:yes stop_codon:yes gene_type:complete
MIKNFLKNYLILLILSVPLFGYYFIFEFQYPDYFICNELLNYKINIFSNNFVFSYPKSCDQELYQRGFTNIKEIFAEDFNYQDRPLYILLVSTVNIFIQLTINIFNLSVFNTTYLSTFLTQIGIASLSVVLIKKIYFKNQDHTFFNSILISLVLLLSPLFKWGIFDPSHQLLTFVAILISIYFVKSAQIIDLKKSLFFGILFLLHRSFLVTFAWILLYEIYKNKKNILKDFNYGCFLFSLVPTIFYQIYIRLILGNKGYDANAEYWGQFIWIFDFLRGKVNYESEWHCVTIPANFICYVQDNLRLLVYLFIPLLFLIYFYINKYITNKSFEENIKLTISISLFLYIFWSFIGWYPPIRFSYYSLGHFLIILFIKFLITYPNNPGKFLISSSYILYALNLNHWNSPSLIEINSSMYVSIILFLLFIFYDKIFILKVEAK